MAEKLGQHFLRSKKVAAEIVDTANVSAKDIVLEIGPGKGILTEKMLPLAGKIIAVEKDKDLISFLREKFKKYIKDGRLDILHQDIRDFDPSILDFYDFRYKVVANIPYYITGEIIRKFLTSDYKPESMTLLIQKEVAERITTKNGKESLSSLSVKAFGDPKKINKVSAKMFSPPPKVDSAILSIKNISNKFFKDMKEEDFFAFLKQGFSQKRKKMFKNLSREYDKKRLENAFKECGISEDVRAEDVSIRQWKCLVKRYIS